MNFIKKIILTLIIIMFSSSWAQKYNYKYKKHLNYQNKYIYIKNNIFLIKINQINGNINKILFLKYKNNKLNKNLTNKLNINILKEENNTKKKNIFLDKKKIYINKKYIKILWEKKKNKIKYIKSIFLNKNSYKLYINLKIKNNSGKKIFYKIYNKLINNENTKNNFNNISFLNKKNIFKKYFIENIKNNKIFKDNLKWMSISEKYFTTTLVIPNNLNKYNKIYIKKKNNNIIYKYINNFNIKPKKKKIINYKLWIGPNLIEYLNKIEKKVDLNRDYGKLWFFSKPILILMNYINKIVNNWGYTIIIVTIIFKIITYPLNKLQLLTLDKIKNIQPKIKKIKKKYKNNKYKLNKKILNLYKKYNINPIIGFIIVIIQIPIFISIYNVISYSVEFKNSKFLFWIKDLSSYDKYYLFPLIMGISMILLQKKNNFEKNTNIFFIPLIFTILSLYFPSGVLLYYITNNFLTFIQQNIFN